MATHTPFHSTPMGRQYYEVTLPALIKSMNRLAKALEETNELLENVNKKLLELDVELWAKAWAKKHKKKS